MVAAIIRQESAFVPGIESRAGAVGFMQLLPRTGPNWRRGEGSPPGLPSLLWVPEVNVHLGTAYLEQLLERHGATWPWCSPPTMPVPPGRPAGGSSRRRTITNVLSSGFPSAKTRQYVKNVLRNGRPLPMALTPKDEATARLSKFSLDPLLPPFTPWRIWGIRTAVRRSRTGVVPCCFAPYRRLPV